MAITYFFVSVALLVLVSAFLVGYYVGREKARQDSYDSLTGWKLIKESE